MHEGKVKRRIAGTHSIRLRTTSHCVGESDARLRHSCVIRRLKCVSEHAQLERRLSGWKIEENIY